MTRVKICGITRVQDGLDALDAGADALGFVFAEGSRRRLEGDTGRLLLGTVRARARRPFLAVAVLAGADSEAARRHLVEHGFDRVQLHGAASPAAVAACAAVSAVGPAALWAGLRVRDRASLAGYSDFACEALVLDAFDPERLGGTGATFAWELATPVAAARRVVLAGGLTPENVAAAVACVRPWMVDVSTGVESSPGIKDPERVRAFLAAARSADAEHDPARP